MKLYYKPGACSMASHIALIETGQEFQIDKVDTASMTTETGADFAKVNPNGYVPALELDTGDVVTEGAAVLQFIGDMAPATGLTPEAGTMPRVRVQQQLNFIASELHKAFGPFFSATPLEGEQKDAAVARLELQLGRLERELSDGRDYLIGGLFTVADCYAFVVSNWANAIGMGLAKFPRLEAYVARIAQRPSVQSALRAEGLA